MGEVFFKVSGPGVKGAVQEAVKAGKDVVFVCDYDSLGRILRIGYAFSERGKKEIPRNRIKWFKKDEAYIVKGKHPAKDGRIAELEVEYVPPNLEKKERQFLLELPLGKSNNVLLRNIFRLRGNIIKSFVVQSEIKITEDGKQEWKPIVRYDCAHGFIHRDLINREGRKTKEKLAAQNLKGAIKTAIEEMKNSLRIWLVKLGYESEASELFGKISINEDLDTAKEFLLRLTENPEMITKTPSTFKHVKDAIDYVERIWPP